MNKKFFLLLLFGILIRTFFVFQAYHGDLNNNISWGKAVYENGLSDFYERETWEYSVPNQPPLYMLIFGLCYALYRNISLLGTYLNETVSIFPSQFIWFWEIWGKTIVFKLPGVLSDIAIAVLFYNYFLQKKNRKIGLLVSAVWILNPVTWYNSAVWGQTDSVVNLLGISAIIFLIQKKYNMSSIFFVLSLLYKPSLLIFTPLLLIYLYKDRISVKSLSNAFVMSLTVAIGIGIWFYPHLDLPIWFTKLYFGRFLSGEIGDLSANAFNFWWLVDSGKVLDSTFYFSVPARAWGIIFFAFGYIAVILNFLKKQSEKNLLYALLIATLLSFVLMTRIHERYLYPFFPIATLLLGFNLGRWFTRIYILFSITHLLNLYHLFWYPSNNFLENLYLIPDFAITISFINIALFALIASKFSKINT